MQSNTVVPSNLENMTTQGLFVTFPDVIRTNDPNLPADPDNMNDLRAQQADDILLACEDGYNEDVNLETLSDMLSKMGHWCDLNHFQMADAMKMAAATYSDETGAKGRQFTA